MGKTVKTEDKVVPAKGKSPSIKKAKKADRKKATSVAKKDGKSAEQRIMEVLAKFHATGRGVEKETVLKMTDIASKTLCNILPKLKNKNWVEVNGSTISLTQAGAKEMGDKAKVGTNNDEIHDLLKATMTKSQVKLFEALLDGEIHTKDAIATNLGYDGCKTKAFVNLTGALRGKQIVDYPEKDKIQLNLAMCYPFGK